MSPRYGASPSEWEQLSRLGLQADLLPIVSDPSAQISPNSQLKEIGKTPSCFNPVGQVVGIPKWTQRNSTPDEIAGWKQDGRLGIGVQTRLVRAIDIDVDDLALAREIRGAFELELGVLPARTRSNSGKCLLIVKVQGNFKKTSFDVAGGRVEILGNGQQFVAVGTHPSGQRYDWAGGLPQDIPEVSAAELVDSIRHVHKSFGKGSPPDAIGATGAGDGLDFDSLIALAGVTDQTIEQVAAALDFLAPFIADSYELWIKIGNALSTLREAGYGPTALELWHKFSAASPRYSMHEADEKWQGFKPNRTDYRAIFAEAYRRDWQPPTTPAFVDDLSDLGNVAVLAWLNPGSLKFVVERGTWLHWDGEKWLWDEAGSHIQEAAQAISDFLRDRAEHKKKRLDDPSLDAATRSRLERQIDELIKWSKKCRSRKAITDCISLAQCDKRFTISVQDLDRDPLLLGVENGVVDLQTGQLRPNAMKDLVTRRCPVRYDPSAPNQRWVQFIDEVTGKQWDDAPTIYPRKPLAEYVQRALGYCLTGLTCEQKMFFAIGVGSNGKNVLFDMVQAVLGPYAHSIVAEALMMGRYPHDAERASPVLASLAGSRLAICSESRDGQRLDVSMVKRHTGGGVLTARFMRENQFSFEISHKLVLMTNSHPDLDQIDDAIRGRLHLIPFDVRWNRPSEVRRNERLPDGDKELLSKLKLELEGILAWLVQGAVKYHAEGLNPPPEVIQFTGAYFDDQDAVGRFLEACGRCDANGGVSATAAFNAFNSWASQCDLPPSMSVKAFSTALKLHAVERKRVKAGTFYGLVLPKGEPSSW